MCREVEGGGVELLAGAPPVSVCTGSVQCAPSLSVCACDTRLHKSEKLLHLHGIA